jgi:hypothetical protein
LLAQNPETIMDTTPDLGLLFIAAWCGVGCGMVLSWYLVHRYGDADGNKRCQKRP